MDSYGSNSNGYDLPMGYDETGKNSRAGAGKDTDYMPRNLPKKGGNNSALQQGMRSLGKNRDGRNKLPQ